MTTIHALLVLGAPLAVSGLGARLHPRPAAVLGGREPTVVAQGPPGAPATYVLVADPALTGRAR